MFLVTNENMGLCLYMLPIYHMKQPNYLVLWSKDKTFRSYRYLVAIYQSRNVQKNISKIWWVMLKKEIFLNKRIRCCKTRIAIFWCQLKTGARFAFVVICCHFFKFGHQVAFFLLITSTITVLIINLCTLVATLSNVKTSRGK